MSVPYRHARALYQIMTAHPPQEFSNKIHGYQPLLKQIKKTLLDGQARIEAERVRTYWETGNLIRIHIKQNKARADYGTDLVRRLSGDLKIDRSTLHRCVQFAEKYSSSQIVARRRLFTWSHYRKLIAIPDDRERLLIEEQAGRNGWSAEELHTRVKIRKFSTETEKDSAPTNALLTPLCGQLYTYRFVSRPVLGDNPEGRELLLDLGFGVFKDIDARVAAKFSDQTVVESRWKDGQYTFASGERTTKDLFTYRAYIEKVVDGDTLKVRIDQGFDIWNRQILRLRDIDCPEVGTKEGDEVKNFVRSLLKEASLIILRSSRSDKYDRYLADVFIPQDNTTNPMNSIYLNNLLLEKGHARRL
ncbi:MAG: thermonuclease family protein [Candidatus Omnitrophica bacterium]|nr:thermonuclease family protein [Candidatus Omnitrophota bacterium]